MTGDLVARIRLEADMADRPGQFERLHAIADEVAALSKPGRCGTGSATPAE